MSKSNEILEKNINELGKKLVELRKIEYVTIDEIFNIARTDFRNYRSVFKTYVNLVDTFLNSVKSRGKTDKSKEIIENILNKLNSEIEEIDVVCDKMINNFDYPINNEFPCVAIYRCLQDVSIHIMHYIDKIEHEFGVKYKKKPIENNITINIDIPTDKEIENLIEEVKSYVSNSGSNR